MTFSGRSMEPIYYDGVLISHNAEYDPIPMREDIKCQGLVLGVCDKSYFE